MMKRFLVVAAFLCVLLPSCRRGGDTANGTAEAEANDTIPALGFWIEDHTDRPGVVRSGEIFTGLMTRLGLASADAYKLAQLCDTVFDVRKMRAGNTYHAYYSGDSLSLKLEYLVYSNDKVRSTVFKCADSLAVWTYDKPVSIERKVVDVTIRESLWNDLIRAGSSPMLIVSLADIFAWTVNFFGLQDGDRFRAIYSQKVCEGEIIDISNVEFGIYDGGKASVCAICLDLHDGGNKYWSETGESLKKAFLKAPLKFNRISSRFSYSRKHPVTGKVRAHTAVDYAAPTGTPVHSIGDGKVTLCGWDSHGGGNRIRIRHMNGYETAYLHLSGYAKGIKAGTTVHQGQVIGYVGSTGLSTGPHLDFRVWKDGTPIDPLKMISPPSEPIQKEYLDSLKVLRDKYLRELDSVPQL